MTLRARLEELKKMGWTIDDLIELTSELEELVGRLKYDNDKKTMELKQDFIKDIKKHNVDMETYEEVSKMLISLGITPNLKGYHYTIEAVLMGIKDKKVFTMITTGLYDGVAKKYNTTWQCVERCIRHVVEKSWQMTSDENRAAILGVLSESDPTCAEFIGLICERVVCNLANKGTIKI